MEDNIITFWIATKITSETRKNYLHQCISSILAQTNNSYEIIISDDKSDIEVDWSQYTNNQKIKIFHQESSLWIFRNFNFCLQKTQTKWFIPMGDDDTINSDFVETILNTYERYDDVDIFYFTHENIDGTWKIYDRAQTWLTEGYFFNGKSKADCWRLLWNSSVSFFSVINTEKIKKLWGIPDLWMSSDGYLAYMYFINLKGYYIDKCLAKLRRHKENASGHNNIIAFTEERAILLKKIIYDFWDKFNAEMRSHLNAEILNIEYWHINLMKQFRDHWRLRGLKYFIWDAKTQRLTAKLLIICIIGIILWTKIQAWFNFINISYEWMIVKIRKFIY